MKTRFPNVFPSVCKDCTERAVGCHGSCERYKDAKAAYDAKVEQKWENIRNEVTIGRYIKQSVARNRKARERLERK